MISFIQSKVVIERCLFSTIALAPPFLSVNFWSFCWYNWGGIGCETWPQVAVAGRGRFCWNDVPIVRLGLAERLLLHLTCPTPQPQNPAWPMARVAQSKRSSSSHQTSDKSFGFSLAKRKQWMWRIIGKRGNELGHRGCRMGWVEIVGFKFPIFFVVVAKSGR